MGSIKCSNCQAEIPESAQKCPECGAHVTHASAPPLSAAPSAPADKLALAKELGSAESQLADFETQLRQAEREAASARSGRNIGGIGILLGIISLFFFWPLAFIGLAGLLAYVTQAVKVNDADGRAADITARMSKVRARKAELAAMLAVL